MAGPVGRLVGGRRCAGLTPDGNTLVIAGSDSTVTVWHLRRSVFLHTDYVTAVDGTVAFAMTRSGRLG